MTLPMASVAHAERAQRRFRQKFGRLHGVRGIGVTWDENGDAHIRVNDSASRETLIKVIASEYDGVAVEFRSVRNMRTFG